MKQVIHHWGSRCATVLWAIFISCYTLTASGQFELPDTQLWLLDLGQQPVAVSALTEAHGYHNQPAFSHDGNTLFYSKGELADDGLSYTEIYALDLPTRQQRRITQTTTSEFSPTPMPQTDKFPAGLLSVVRVQADGAQQLWQIDPQAQQADQQILPNDAVGYHLWLSAQEVLLFVLGDPQHLLQLWRLQDQPSAPPVQIATDIGRSLARTDQALEFLFVQNPGQILRHHPYRRSRPMPVANLPTSSQDFARAANGSLWTGQGGRLLFHSGTTATANWQTFIDLSEHGIGDISRLRFAPGSNWQLVLVAVTSSHQ